ncbi:hypothetical protein SAMN05444128_0477 [Pontibacter indicus]|uniref:Uncharacterized protein n=1 Tax=Pontibacter indicus TaxID=1317125 RepID=A0A1R3WGW4_9BACT|nr:hypothetical protein SAMN05444128_0477 [Pontibacter indicus]
MKTISNASPSLGWMKVYKATLDYSFKIDDVRKLQLHETTSESGAIPIKMHTS